MEFTYSNHGRDFAEVVIGSLLVGQEAAEEEKSIHFHVLVSLWHNTQISIPLTVPFWGV